MNSSISKSAMLKHHSISSVFLQHASELNSQLLTGLNQYIDDESTRKTHHFNGRFENIYIATDKLPALNTLIDSVLDYSADILHKKKDQLKAGLWFNVMQPGDSTTLHKHDDDDELLSAVYYVKVPENSGRLRLGQALSTNNSTQGNLITELKPQAGMLVFFAANMPHEVTENLSQESRVSLGINIGPLHSDDSD